MKKLLLAFAICAMTFNANAQIQTPQPSPAAKLTQKVGLTDITVEYSRPGVKGRTIFGGLEPWGTVWRTGANKNTTITFSDDVTFAGQDVKAGSYAIFTKLNSAKEWDVMLYSDTNNWGVPREWDDSKVVATAKVNVMEIPFNVETFAIDINNITDNGGSLELIWEKSYAAIPFTVPTDKTVSAAIDKVMNGPGAADYYASAVYYMNAGKDINQAKAWMEKAMSMIEKPGFWQLRQQSLIYAKAGEKDKAIATAKKSLEGAKAAGNQGYVKMNMDSLKEWGAM
ncbi:DUF2911 domain-containing protein [Psychroserpens sp.]|uniref:DUF2911 domain-containing protein n=1 Tax=Psychroserpens sp. TaxID=2020870 RepID=UPI001B018F7E|nr:DUF2911 domain-containing protein [Psychroserpens sp.]MBO6607540.1 DUF2911 domain-containing protein [Psychroserpens sp.]MBO6631843.1 DUF2911 domain-containing protein [Psychroserpens sp.]MBO6655200.1 DUF2911 domain-containing protein [Psychroserpens sp.]MBO6683210.1 DUF2911 domain-containing protein [Psychroserpens sp.]MBO6749774.1 DUF2911 domain-containing protein [Psychroserpens sp.]